MFSERPGYRIDSRTIKRGSRPSIVIVSFVESSNLCIYAIIFIGSYLSLFVVWSWCLSCLSWQSQVHRKRFSYASSIAVSVLEILPVHPCGRFISSTSLQNLHYLFAIFKGCICRPLSNKIGFTQFGLQLQKIRHFRFAKKSFYLSPFGFIIFSWTMMFLCIILLCSVWRFQRVQDYRKRSSWVKVIAFPICKWELLPFPIYFYIIFLDYDVYLHILVVLVVTSPTSPRLSKTEFVGESYCNSISEYFF